MTDFDSAADDLGRSLAIVGLACRFPGADDARAFWRNLRDGVESITFFTPEELIAAGTSERLARDPDFVRARGVVDRAEWFDAELFGYSPREAELMDPQHRLFLECAWAALEDAGCDPRRYQGAVGLFAGVGRTSYLYTNVLANPELLRSLGVQQAIIGNDKDFLTTHVAYRLGLRGPCVGVQTACSTSLVATHLACQALLTHQCDAALAGGVSVLLPQVSGTRFREGGVFSPDGHCRAFDAAAGGTVPGGGAGIVVLKRLEDALADGDPIRAVVRGSAVNNDGAAKAGYTAPSVDGQAEVVALAHAVSGVEPESIGYVEGHGTGTALGDPIEVQALREAFGAAGGRRGFCALGSVKTNIGHLDTAAGVAGLIKATLALEHGELPPSLHFERPNPRIDLEDGPFYVNDRLRAWERRGGPRRAGVSSFGIGGTNAHVVLEEPPAPTPSENVRPQQLLVLSARTPTALDTATDNLAQFLREDPEVSLADVAHTLQTGRKLFAFRRSVAVNGVADAVEALTS
ncbi:MAG TPA: polyketide synthase, partial [Thermoanaerobaculia bacterium]